MSSNQVRWNAEVFMSDKKGMHNGGKKKNKKKKRTGKKRMEIRGPHPYDSNGQTKKTGPIFYLRVRSPFRHDDTNRVVAKRVMYIMFLAHARNNARATKCQFSTITVTRPPLKYAETNSLLSPSYLSARSCYLYVVSPELLTRLTG